MYQEPISGRAPGMMLLYHLSYAYSNMRPNTSVADAYNTHIRVRNCGLIWPLTENRDWCKWGMLWHWQTANRPALIFWWILMSVRMYNVNVHTRIDRKFSNKLYAVFCIFEYLLCVACRWGGPKDITIMLWRQIYIYIKTNRPFILFTIMMHRSFSKWISQ